MCVAAAHVFTSSSAARIGHDVRQLQSFHMLTPEQEATVRAIRKLVDFWQITADEVDMGPQAPRAPAPPPPAPKGPKYRHPLTLQTWDGEGMQPQWLKEALTREGYTVEELRVSPDALA